MLINGATKASEEAFAYILYGVSAAEIASLVDLVCQRENRKSRSAGILYINTKYVANLLGTDITILVRSQTWDSNEHTDLMPVREYQITTDEWDVNVVIHHGNIGEWVDDRIARGVGRIDGRKSLVSKPYFDGDVETYLSQMSILRLMLDMVEAA